MTFASTVLLENKITERKRKRTITPSESTPSTQFKRRISVAEAKSSQNMWSLTEHMFREQAVRTLQRKFREKHHYEFKGKYKETLNGRLTMRFLKEPLGDKYLEHVDHILKGNWLELDFNDPEFIRNIYKALRHNLINPYQLSTTTLWHHAIDFFKDSENKAHVNLYSFEEKGPYNLADISYATAKNIANFQLALKDLPIEERNYLTVDFPYEHEIIYLLFIMTRLKQKPSAYTTTFLSILEKYFAKTDTSNETCHSLLQDLPNLYKKENNEAAFKFLIKKFRILYPNIISEAKEGDDLLRIVALALTKAGRTGEINKVSQTIGNFLLLGGNLLTNEQAPSLVISPNYNKDNPKSPLLCMVLPPLSSLQKLQKAFHHSDTTYPELTIGRLSPHDLLRILMKPNHNLRPVELVHPDIRGENMPHGAYTTPFMLTWHDYFHLWRNGSNMYKNLICHFITVLPRYTGFNMSKDIWNLVDMDFSVGRIIRECEAGKADEKIEDCKLEMLEMILDKMGNSFFSSLEYYDSNLIILIDMNLNREVWKENLGAYPEDYFPQDEKKLLGERWLTVSSTHYKFRNFHSAFEKMREIILAHPKDNVYQASLFYILMFRLRNYPESCAIINDIDRIGMGTFFKWDRNKGIYFSSEITFSETIFIETLYGEELPNNLKLYKESEEVKSLWMACTREQYDIVNSLLPEQAKFINQTYQYSKCTPFFIACQSGRTDIVNLLLECKADVDKPRPNNGGTPLLIASVSNHSEVVLTLLRNGANPNLTWEEKSIFEYATEGDIKRHILRAQIESFVKTLETTENKESVSPRFFKAADRTGDLIQAKLLLDNDLNSEGLSSSHPILSVLLTRAASLPKSLVHLTIK